jgi:serine/threonine-protein kinase
VQPDIPGPIAHYNLLERIGAGALGPMYRARDTRFGRTVALKLAPDASFADAAARDAFLEQARAATTLSHPNIATLFEVGEYDGGCYLAYEFASGVTLGKENAGRAMNPRRAVELTVQITEALASGHAHGVLHTDIRPDTIFVTQKGSAKVLEFGMSQWTRGGQTRARAASDPQSLGADALAIVSYMSPEQALGAPLDARTDIFSLGVVLHEMLTGRNPFAAPSAARTVANILSHTPGASAEKATAASDVSAIVWRALSKDADHRHQSAASLSAELRTVGAILDVRSGDAAPGELLPLDDDHGSGKWWAIALGGAALALVVWWMVR